MTTITEAVKNILEDSRCEISAELVNQLHGCKDESKSAVERKLDALFAVQQAEYVPVVLLRNLERAKG